MIALQEGDFPFDWFVAAIDALEKERRKNNKK